MRGNSRAVPVQLPDNSLHFPGNSGQFSTSFRPVTELFPEPTQYPNTSSFAGEGIGKKCFLTKHKGRHRNENDV